jgi:hypothetical protein
LLSAKPNDPALEGILICNCELFIVADPPVIAVVANPTKLECP